MDDVDATDACRHEGEGLDPYQEADRLVREAERWDDERSYARARDAIRELPEENALQRLRKASVMHAFAEWKDDADLLFEARTMYEDVARSPELARPFRDLAAQFAVETKEDEREARHDRRR